MKAMVLSLVTINTDFNAHVECFTGRGGATRNFVEINAEICVEQREDKDYAEGRP